METGWMGGWVDGRESGFKDCLQQSKTTGHGWPSFRKKQKSVLYNVWIKHMGNSNLNYQLKTPE